MRKTWDNPIVHTMPADVCVPAEVRIGNVRVAPATVLAPMAGVTDTVFRRFMRNASLFTNSTEDHPRLSQDGLTEQIEADITNVQSGCGLNMTEFTSADGLARCRESRRKRYLTFYDDEHPISAQLFGSDPKVVAD